MICRVGCAAHHQQQPNIQMPKADHVPHLTSYEPYFTMQPKESAANRCGCRGQHGHLPDHAGLFNMQFDA